jgi:alkane 1-monooxygenase
MGDSLRIPLHDSSIGFLLAYAIPAVSVLGSWVGQLTGHPDLFAFLPVFVVFVWVPVHNLLWRRPPQPLPDAVAASSVWRNYYRVLPLLSVPGQLVMIYVAADLWSSGVLNAWGCLGHLWSTGLCSALFAINISHELIHRRQRLDRTLGGILLSIVGFGTFKLVHLRVHHRHVGTPFDFATAPRGQSLYAFWRQNLVGTVREALRIERRRLSKSGKSLWASELAAWYGLTLLWCGVALLLWGLTGLVFFGLQCLLAILYLGWTDYLQHYGLTRKPNSMGRYERVQAHHSWSEDHRLSNLFLLNLMRHGDHHAKPNRPYQELQYDRRTPAYPYDFSIMSLLALVPPLFRQVVHPHLDRLDRQ